MTVTAASSLDGGSDDLGCTRAVLEAALRKDSVIEQLIRSGFDAGSPPVRELVARMAPIRVNAPEQLAAYAQARHTAAARLDSLRERVSPKGPAILERITDEEHPRFIPASLVGLFGLSIVATALFFIIPNLEAVVLSVGVAAGVLAALLLRVQVRRYSINRDRKRRRELSAERALSRAIDEDAELRIARENEAFRLQTLVEVYGIPQAMGAVVQLARDQAAAAEDAAREQATRRLSQQMVVPPWKHLSEGHDQAGFVRTPAFAHLGLLMRYLDRGAIGLAGQRGAGKSRLLKAACAGSFDESVPRPSLGFHVSAPVVYDQKDMIFVLFGELHREIGRRTAEMNRSSATPAGNSPGEDEGFKLELDLRRAKFIDRLVQTVLCVAVLGCLWIGLSRWTIATGDLGAIRACLAVAALGVGFLSLGPRLELLLDMMHRTVPKTTVVSPRRLMVMARFLAFTASGYFGTKLANWVFWKFVHRTAPGSGLVRFLWRWYQSGLGTWHSFVVVAAIATAWAFTRTSEGYGQRELVWFSRDVPEPFTKLMAHGHARLDKLDFEVTRSASAETTIGTPSVGWLPFTLSRRRSASEAAKRRPLSLPEMIDEFVSHCREAASPELFGRVIIGIDELDKISDEQRAIDFLNGLKGLFGVPNVFYVISVSENAIRSFERRGVPFRDVFDSSFDEIIRVDEFDRGVARRLLDQRGIDVPDPFVWAVFCLSGGLPRDTIRLMRSMLQQFQTDSSIGLSEAVRALIDEEMSTKGRATFEYIATLAADQAVNEITSATRHLAHCPTSEARLSVEALRRLSGAAGEAAAAVEGLVVFCDLLFDLEDLLCSGEQWIFEAIDANPAAFPGSMEKFAEARRLIAVSPIAAREVSGAFREAWRTLRAEHDAQAEKVGKEAKGVGRNVRGGRS